MAESNPYEQIASGLAPDTWEPYNAKTEAKESDPYSAIVNQAAANPPYMPTGIIQPTAETYTPPTYEEPAPPPKPKPSIDFSGVGQAIQGMGQNIQHGLQNEGFRQARRGIYGANIPGTEIPGGIVQDVANLGMSAERAGKGLMTHPAKSIQAGTAGAAAGATALAENPIAFATNIATAPANAVINALVPPHLHGVANRIIQEQLKQYIPSIEPNQQSLGYNQLVGGKPIQQRVLEGIGQGTEKKFPDAANVGGIAGNVVGGIAGGAALAPALEAAVATKIAPLFNNLLLKGGIKPAIKVLDNVAATNPSLAYKIARGAAVNMAINPAFEAGGKAAYGQPMGVSTKGEAEAGLLGGLGGAFAREAPPHSETVTGEILPEGPPRIAEREPIIPSAPKRIGYGEVSKRRRLSDIKATEEAGEPLVTPPAAPEVPESVRLRQQQPIAALEDIPKYQREALYPWQKSGYIPQGMTPQGIAPERAAWKQTVEEAQQEQPSQETRQVGQVIKPKEEPQIKQPEAQAQPQIQPQKLSEIVKPAKTEKTPKTYAWEDPNLSPAERFAAANKIMVSTRVEKLGKAAQDYVATHWEDREAAQGRQPQMGESVKTPELQGRVEETVKAEEAPKSRAQALYEKHNVVPPREESLEPASNISPEQRKAKANQYLTDRIPQKDIEDIHNGKNIDWNNPEKQLVRLRRPLISSQQKPLLDEYGNPRWGTSWVSGRIENQGGQKIFRVLRNHSPNRTRGEAQSIHDTSLNRETLDKATEELTPEETQKIQRQAPHAAEEGTRPFQEEMLTKHKKVIKAAEEGSPESVAKETKKTTPKEKQVATPLEGDPLINAEALKQLAKDFIEPEAGSGVTEAPLKAIGAILKSPYTIPKALWNSRFSKEIVRPILEAKTTMDEIRTETQALGDDLANKMWKNFGAEALRGWGIKMTGKFGKEARRAMYKETPDEILDSANHPTWTDQQREAVFWKKVYRLKQREAIDDFREKHSKKISPRLDRVLDDVHRGLLSPGERNYAGMSGWDLLTEGLGHAAYHGIFFLNPKTHELIMTHPLQTGSAVTSPIDIANAYRLMASNKTVQKFLRGMQPFTTDVRFEATKDFMEQAPWLKAMNTPLSKIIERDFMSGRLNNEVIGLAGMLKEHGQAKTLQLMEDVVNGADLDSGPLTFDERASMAASALQAIHDATGSGTAGVSRTALQSSGLGRMIFQLSGYHQQIQRFYANQAGRLLAGKTFGERADALAKLTVMMSATTLLGGNLIPKEVNDEFDIAMIKASPEMYLAMQKMQDMLNLPKYAQADISGHVSNSFINWTGNIGLESLASTARAIFHPVKSDTPEMRARKVIAGLLMVAYIDGAPGAAVSTGVAKGVENVAQGRKITSVYGGSPISRYGQVPIAKGQQKYTDVWDGISHALRDVLVMGVGSDEGNWKKQNEIANKFKRAGKPIPWEQLKVDYPTSITPASK